MKTYTVLLLWISVFITFQSHALREAYQNGGTKRLLTEISKKPATLVKRAIIVAGQSNTCSGAGDVILPPDFAKKNMLQLGRGNDNFDEVPLTFYSVQHISQYMDRASFASMFCYYYYDLLKNQSHGDNVQLLLIPCGAGGSGWADSQYPNNSWRTDAAYFKDLVKRIKWAKAAGYQIDGFLWHQGETDSLYQTPNYRDILMNFIQSVREHVGNQDLPFILGQMVPAWVGTNPALVACQSMIDSLPTQVPFTYAVSGSGLTSNNANDIIHYSAAAHYELGKRYYDGFVAAKNNNSPSAYSAPRGGENLILNHSLAGGLFGNQLDAIRKNDANPSSNLHSRLGDIWRYKNADGYYHFKLVVVNGADLTDKHFEWKQRYNPFGISDTFFEERADKKIISNTMEIDTTINSQGFASLVYFAVKPGGTITTLFHGDIRYSIANWWLAVGQSNNFNGRMPIKSGQLGVTHIRLYAIKE